MSNLVKKILFITGTRADFGKLKPLIKSLQDYSDFESHLFVTGMHLQPLYGYTFIEVQKSGFKNLYTFENYTQEATMDLTLAKTIQGFSNLVKELQPDLIVIHGDRVEALSGAIVGSLNNILVAHIEGGELSGTVDELIRHAVSKLSHIHFVSNDEAKKRLIQMGERPESIYVIGSPDIDVMFSENLPEISKVKQYYEINFDKYAIALFHPVTTEINELKHQAEQFVEGLIDSNQNYIVIYPNNDMGSSTILKSYERIINHKNFRIFPSLRFEYFLTLLKGSNFIIGNSSAGVREAPVYGIPAINIGSRQENRSLDSQIINIKCSKEDILKAINSIGFHSVDKEFNFGKGNSAELFIKTLKEKLIWNINHQKQFMDL